MIDYQVPGDRDEPGADVVALPGEASDAAQRAQKGLADDVLGHRPAAHPVEHIAEDHLQVGVVQPAESLVVALLRAADQFGDIRFRAHEVLGRRWIGHPGCAAADRSARG